VTPVFIPSVWELVVPPRIHIFLWLAAYNKIMTRDHLEKRKMNKPLHCVFCSEHGNVQHLFFDCTVAKLVWTQISLFFNLQVGTSMLSVASRWVAGKKLDMLNFVSAAVLWALWKHRNNIVFNGVCWISLKQMWSLLLNTIRKWCLLFGEHMLERIDAFCVHIQTLLREPHLIRWKG
jgi:hypothetical protein